MPAATPWAVRVAMMSSASTPTCSSDVIRRLSKISLISGT